MSAEENSIASTIVWRRDWAPHLFSFRVARPAGLVFVPGQFVRLGVEGDQDGGAMVWRAYSVASPPDAPHLEFYSIVVPDGPFSQPLSKRRVGDAIHLGSSVYGFLRTDRFQGGRRLWLIASGTGIAPFMAMLGDDAIWSAYEDIVLVHSVRIPGELAYREEIEALAHGSRDQASRAQLRAQFHYAPTLTRERVEGMRHGRITTQLADGSLERSLALAVDAQDSRLMICGNPSMIKEIRAMLAERGMTAVRRETPGQFIVENFW